MIGCQKRKFLSTQQCLRLLSFRGSSCKRGLKRRLLVVCILDCLPVTKNFFSNQYTISIIVSIQAFILCPISLDLDREEIWRTLICHGPSSIFSTIIKVADRSLSKANESQRLIIIYFPRPFCSLPFFLYVSFSMLAFLASILPFILIVLVASSDSFLTLF